VNHITYSDTSRTMGNISYSDTSRTRDHFSFYWIQIGQWSYLSDASRTMDHISYLQDTGKTLAMLVRGNRARVQIGKIQVEQLITLVRYQQDSG
jgi:hypothetical protein